MTGESNGKLVVKKMIPEIKFTKLFINGDFVDSLSGLSFFPCFFHFHIALFTLTLMVFTHAYASLLKFCYLVGVLKNNNYM